MIDRETAMRWGLALLALSAGISGCRLDDLKASGGSFDKNRLEKLAAPDAAIETETTIETHAEPVVIEDGLGVERTYFQTRSPITIVINPSVASPGDVFSLFNDSTSAALVNAQAVALAAVGDDREFTIAAALESRESIALAPYSLTLTLYPLDPQMKTALGYGDNRLRLVVADTGGDKLATTVIKRGDFTIFGRGSGAFATDGEDGNGLELRFGEISKASLTNGQHSLTIGRVSLWSR